MANEKRKPVVETKVIKQVRSGKFKVAVMEMKKTYLPDKDQKDKRGFSQSGYHIR